MFNLFSRETSNASVWMWLDVRGWFQKKGAESKEKSLQNMDISSKIFRRNIKCRTVSWFFHQIKKQENYCVFNKHIFCQINLTWKSQNNHHLFFLFFLISKKMNFIHFVKKNKWMCFSPWKCGNQWYIQMICGEYLGWKIIYIHRPNQANKRIDCCSRMRNIHFNLWIRLENVWIRNSNEWMNG